MGTGPTVFGTGPSYLIPSGTGTVVLPISKPFDLHRWTAPIFSNHRKICKTLIAHDMLPFFI